MRHNAGRMLMVLAFSWLAMVVMGLVTPLAMKIGDKWIALGTAAVVMIAAIPVCVLAERQHPERNCQRLWLWCFLMNSAANGFAMAAFYIHGECAVSTGALLQGMLPAMGVMALASALLLVLPEHRKLALAAAGLLAAALLAASLIPAVWTAQPQRSAMFFGALTAVFYLFSCALTTGQGERPVLRIVVFGSFGALLIIILVVLTIISEGDVLDFADFDLRDVFSSRRKKRNL